MMTGKYDDVIERNVLILLKRTVRISEKRFLRLVCLDIESGELIMLADKNGRPVEGLHSWNKDIGALKEMQVVKAKFLIFLAASKSKNSVALFVSRFEVVAKDVNLSEYVEKITTIKMKEMLEEKARVLSKEPGEYEETAPGIPCKQPAILSAEEYFTNLVTAESPQFRYDLVELCNSQLADRTPLLWNIKVKITDERFPASMLENKFFSGLALFHVSCDSENTICFFAERLYGNFTDRRIDGFSGFTKRIEDIKGLPEMLFSPELTDYPDPEDLLEEILEGLDPYDNELTFSDPHSPALENNPGWYAYDQLESYLEQREAILEIESMPSPEEQMDDDISEVLTRLDLLLAKLPEYLISDPQDSNFAVDYRTQEIANPAYVLLEDELSL